MSISGETEKLSGNLGGSDFAAANRLNGTNFDVVHELKQGIGYEIAVFAPAIHLFLGLLHG
jgi:hypothetical protein